MTLVKVKDLSVNYGARSALTRVSLSIEPAEIVTIVGPNGSGKTSLLRAIIGAIKSEQGSVTKRNGIQIGYVPQQLHIDATLPITVQRFLKLPHGATSSEISQALHHSGVPDLFTSQL